MDYGAMREKCVVSYALRVAFKEW
ncbi:hypothetical protein OOU_Y34scaffold00625g1 [Pyricularia oryzae Y34]|uniref:Uncharacterized protein n=1 Tax=Pyricularia oryzae (strain Y34) TaxID=1143189 RepID=A0AA97PJE8_PYRO3|nr:hypothetical protein OOU_Y34scaffold00625g1 [Pyricularia oryzae Y34]